MGRLRTLGLCLGLWAVPLAAQAPIEGSYQSETMEVGSQLVLAPDGRFFWGFSYGALDLVGAGRWTQAEDGAVVLDSEPAVEPPRIELVGRSRDDLPGVAVRLPCDTGEAEQFLRVLVDYADGEQALHNFDNFEFRTYGAEPGLRPPDVATVQVGSQSFGFFSERIPVNAAEANVLTFRFTANDLGRANFRSHRAVITGDELTLEYNGLPIRYRREGSAAGIELPELPPVMRPAADTDVEPVPLAITIGEPIEQLRARAGAALRERSSESELVARGPVDLLLSYGGHSLQFGRVEGGRLPLLVAAVHANVDDERPSVVGMVRFGHQDGPVTLDEALGRAQSLKARLEQAGFAPAEVTVIDPPPFRIMGEPEVASDWSSAAQVLADEERGYAEMDLFVLRSPTHRVQVRLVNSRRIERERCVHAAWPHGDGREWRLLVEIERG